MSRLMRKLGLHRFNNVGPLVDSLLATERVGIHLRQHIGAQCLPTVSLGQRVARGDVVGEVPSENGKSMLGSPVHASIAGRVTEIAGGIIWIERD
jgi:Na+-translocating ferredoxin:NAD+ oxidoreductase RnfC subunit